MLCDNCKERDSVINVTRSDNEKGVVEVHLCERCAAERGIETSSMVWKNNPFSALLTPARQDVGRCPFCSATWSDFRESQKLGCARCYTTFEQQLRDRVLRRVHGSSRHVGKRYRAPESSFAPADTMLKDLRERLRVAVEREQFELAARLRDQIRVIDE
jgi:protein arginine kinase activator